MGQGKGKGKGSMPTTTFQRVLCKQYDAIIINNKVISDIHCTVCHKVGTINNRYYIRNNTKVAGFCGGWLRYNVQGPYPEQSKMMGIFLCKSERCLNMIILMSDSDPRYTYESS